MGQVEGPTVPLQSDAPKRVTSELHDSYFRLMTIKHSISKIEWASNDYITQLSSASQLSCRAVGEEMWLGKPHQAEGACGHDGLGSREDADKMQ